MSRMISFIVLLGILVVTAAVFFRVMANFFIPLFLAVLLVIVFGPLHRWVTEKCKGQVRLAAALTTVAILLIVLLPLALVLLQAGVEAKHIYLELAKSEESEEEAGVPQAAGAGATAGPAVAGDSPDGPGVSEPGQSATDSESVGSPAIDIRGATNKLAEWGARFGLSLDPVDMEDAIVARVQAWFGPVAVGAAQFVGLTLLTIGVMIVALYYFLADGPAMVQTLMRLLPLDDRYEEQLIARFADLTRAMVVATLASAVVQGLLLGMGMFFTGIEALFLLMVLTMLLAMVPFIGTAGVWVPVCLWLFFHDRTGAAVFLAIYSVAIVSMADNVIKPLVLHGRANLHPLLALLSVLGGVQALGPIGIFIGPMAVAFLQTLLNMVHTELQSMEREGVAGNIP